MGPGPESKTDKDNGSDSEEDPLDAFMANLEKDAKSQGVKNAKDEQKGKEIARDQLIAADRRAHANQNALEEARTLLDQADRQRRIADQELADTNEQLSELTCTNQALSATKRKLDSEMQTLQVSTF